MALYTDQIVQSLIKARNSLRIKRFLIVTIVSVVLFVPLFVYIYRYVYDKAFTVNLVFLRQIPFAYFQETYQNYLVFAALVAIYLLINILNYRLITSSFEKRFFKKYLNGLLEECKLNDLYIFEKKAVDEEQYKEYLKQLNIPRYKILYTLNDADSQVSFEVSQLQLPQKKFALLLKSNISPSINGFIQFRDHGTPGIDEFNEKEVLRYGYSEKSNLTQGSIYSTLLSETYKFKSPEFLKILKDFKKFLHQNFILEVQNDVLLILINGWKLRLSRRFKEKIRRDEFDHQFEAIFTLHQYLRLICEYLKNLNLPKED